MAVKKAIDTGRISQLPDGTIDPVVADAQWAANTTPPRRSVADVASDKPAPQVSAATREIPQAAARPQRETPEPPTPALSSGGTSLLQAASPRARAKNIESTLTAQKLPWHSFQTHSPFCLQTVRFWR